MGEVIAEDDNNGDGESRKKKPKMLESVTKKIQLKSRGKVFGVVRENYLRSDIPCRSELCFENCSHVTEENADTEKKQSRLPAELTHYLIPATDTVNKFMEILELEEMTGMILIQTVVNNIQQASLRHYRRLCGFLRDPRNASVFFPNEFFKSTYVQRESSCESVEEWQHRMLFRAGCWYYDHLGGQKPIVILTEEEAIIKRFSTERIEVFVMSMKQYLDMFWSHLTHAQELLKALEFAAANPTEDRTKDYFEYYKPEVLEAGLRAGKFVSGRLSVNKHLAHTEATVTRGGEREKTGASDSDILISGNIVMTTSDEILCLYQVTETGTEQWTGTLLWWRSCPRASGRPGPADWWRRTLTGRRTRAGAGPGGLM